MAPVKTSVEDIRGSVTGDDISPPLRRLTSRAPETYKGFSAQLSSLRRLNPEHNQLAALPDSIGQLSSLRRLNPEHNQLAALRGLQEA